MTIKMEEGSFYRTADGRVQGPATAYKRAGYLPRWKVGNLPWLYHDDGRRANSAPPRDELVERLGSASPVEVLQELHVMEQQNTEGPEALTNERKATHGDWNLQSACSDEMKRHMHYQVGWSKLVPSQKEALDMIAVKISRILCGNSNEPDHWDDIAGYAYLGKGGHKPVDNSV